MSEFEQIAKTLDRADQRAGQAVAELRAVQHIGPSSWQDVIGAHIDEMTDQRKEIRTLAQSARSLARPEIERIERGETRIDPEDGNAYVKQTSTPYRVVITDIFGGHECSVPIGEWESWELSPTTSET